LSIILTVKAVEKKFSENEKLIATYFFTEIGTQTGSKSQREIHNRI